MANIQSAKKRVRQTEKKTLRNKARRSQIRTAIRKFEDAARAKDQKGAKLAFEKVEPAIMRGVSKGVLHKKTASRKVSRLSASLKALSAK